MPQLITSTKTRLEAIYVSYRLYPSVLSSPTLHSVRLRHSCHIICRTRPGWPGPHYYPGAIRRADRAHLTRVPWRKGLGMTVLVITSSATDAVGASNIGKRGTATLYAIRAEVEAIVEGAGG